LSQLQVSVIPADCSQDCYRLKAAWVTVAGNWHDVPSWALPWQQDSLGADHHAYGRAEMPNGEPVMGARFELSWPDGAAETSSEPNGWANVPIYAGYDWTSTDGPYGWKQAGDADKLQGLGLPFPPPPWESRLRSVTGGVHVSFFGVWEQVGVD
jgi:hypothetical protein